MDINFNEKQNFYKISVAIHVFLIAICSIFSFIYETIYESIIIGIVFCACFFFYQTIIYFISFIFNRGLLASIVVMVSCFFVCKFTYYNINNLIVDEKKAYFYSQNEIAVKFLNSIKNDDYFSMFDKPPSFSWNRDLEITSSDYSSWCEKSIKSYYLTYSNEYNDEERFNQNMKEFNGWFSNNKESENNPYLFKIIPCSKVDNILK